MRTIGMKLAVFLGASLALASCGSPSQPSGGGGGGGGGGGAATVSIPLTDYGGNQTPQFTPVIVTITAGSSVNWQNNDTVTHTSTGENNLWVQNIPAGGSYSRTFAAAGTFPYTCTIHSGMAGRVIVR